MQLFISCCGIQYQINSIEEPLVISWLTPPDTSFKEKSLKLYFYHNLLLLSFHQMYSLIGFYYARILVQHALHIFTHLSHAAAYNTQ